MNTSAQNLLPNQMIVTFDDISVMPQVKRAIALMKGVKHVSISKAKRKSAIERSMEELRAGQLYEAKNLDDLFAQLND